MTPECLDSAYAGSVRDVFASGFGAAAGSLLFVGLVLSAAAAPLVIRAYDRNVRRLLCMREIPAETVRESSRDVQPPGSSIAAAGRQAGSEKSAADARRQREHRVRRATLVAYVAFVTLTLLMVPFAEIKGIADMIGLFGIVAGLAAIPALGHLRHQGAPRKSIVALGIFVLAALLVQFMASDSDRNPKNLDDVLSTALVVVIFYLTLIHRTLRAVILPATILSVFALAGIVATMVAAIPVVCFGNGGAEGAQTGLHGLALGSVMVTIVGVFVFIGIKFLDWMASAQDRGYLNDISLVSIFGCFLIAVLLTAGVGFERTSYLRMAMTVVAWVGATIAAYAFTMQRSALPTTFRSLLVLRVFSKERSAERLLDGIESRWRFIGPVNQIGGPDLARLNFDLHKFLKFATFRVPQMFLTGRAPIEVLRSRLHGKMDWEGRFRVSEVFCFESAWRAAVEQLIDASEVVLLDLRGFTQARAGTAFEIGLLVRMQCFGKVVTIGDGKTDWTYFDSLVGGASREPGAILRAGGPRFDVECVEALLRVAT